MVTVQALRIWSRYWYELARISILYPERAHQTPVYRFSSAKQARQDRVAQIQMDLEKLLSFVPGISAAVRLSDYYNLIQI